MVASLQDFVATLMQYFAGGLEFLFLAQSQRVAHYFGNIFSGLLTISVIFSAGCPC
jgi:hypothetical protein